MEQRHSTLMVHRGAQPITREALAAIEPPAATYTWKPIKHSEYVHAIHTELAHRQLAITKEEYAVQKDGTRLFGVLDLAFMVSDTFAAALAFRHSNDKSEAVKMYAGLRVFACDNLALSGDEIILDHKHSPRFDLAEALPAAFDKYRDGELALKRSVDALRTTLLSDRQVEHHVYDIFRRKIVPLRLFHPVITEWQANAQTPEAPGSTWQLLNCFTAHTKVLPQGPQMRAMQRLGRYFGFGKVGI
jgi:hypothetical protein